jgi:serine phosphatase RsbU (regulator of sigma subunit)
VENDISLLGIPALESACDAIEQLTGYTLRYMADVDEIHEALWSTVIVGATNEAFGCLGVCNEPNKPTPQPKTHLDNATQLLESISELTEELVSTRLALSERETELAMAIPVVASPDDAKHLQSRLQGVLQGICEGLGCQAAAAYMLDDTTSYLKMRTQWGLPNVRFTEDARSLRGAVADLEALTGNAVVIEDTKLLPHWNIPEAFASAVCVPIASASTLLGTLWMFCDEVRDFSTEETNLVEIVAGRISAELERTVLIEQARQGRQAEQLKDDLTQWQEDRHLLVPPMIEGWEVAAGISCGSSVNYDFYHWRLFDNDCMGIGVGGVPGNDGAATMTKTSIQAALQMQMHHTWRPEDVLGNLNEFAWSNFTGDNFTSMFYGVIDPQTGEFEFAAAGTSAGYILRPHGWEPLGNEAPMLGIDPDVTYDTERASISRGDVVLLISDRNSNGGDGVNTTAIAERLLRHIHQPADELVAIAERMIAEHQSASRKNESSVRCSVVAIKRQE